MTYAIVRIAVPDDNADQSSRDQWTSLLRKLEAQTKAKKGVNVLLAAFCIFGSGLFVCLFALVNFRLRHGDYFLRELPEFFKRRF
jgi:hypothetical protein